MTASILREVNLTTARNLSPLFDEAVRHERPVLITRGGKERGVLMARATLQRLLAHCRFTVHEEAHPGDVRLRLQPLDLEAHGATPAEARQALMAAVRVYVQDYLDRFDFYRHLPERVRLEPHVRRLSLAQSDADLGRMLFRPRP